MGRTANVFNKAKLQTKSIAIIIDKAVDFDCKTRGKGVKTSDTLRADALIKALISVSGEQFNTKACISDKLLNKILEKDAAYVNLVNEQVNVFSGYTYKDLSNMVYYLVWYAICDHSDPTYKTLDEFTKSKNIKE